MNQNNNEEPLGIRTDQIYHQTAISKNNHMVYDPDDSKSVETIIEEDGTITVNSVDNEDFIIDQLKQDLSVRKILETYKENSQKTLMYLMAMQDNKHPLKKGGHGIAYRADALIRYFKMDFSVDEHIVFDAITGIVSSHPEGMVYMIKPSDFKNFVNYRDEKQLYKTFKKGAEGLEFKRLIFEGEDKKDTLSMSWNDICHYHKASKGELAYIEFVPTDFFKALLLSSGIVHGAHYQLKAVTSIKGGKYNMALFYYLNDFKDYVAYKGSKPGHFEIAIDELRYQLSIPSSYESNDIKRRILEPTKEFTETCEYCDFIFNYEPITKKGSVKGYFFKIDSKLYIEDKKDAPPIDPSLPTNNIKNLLDMVGIEYVEADLILLANDMKQYNKTDSDLFDAVYKTKAAIEKGQKNGNAITMPIRYLDSLIRNGVIKENNSSKDSFHRIEKSDIDFDELERQLLNK